MIPHGTSGRRPSGFTLLEILVGTILLLVVLATILLLFRSLTAVQTAQQGKEAQQAINHFHTDLEARLRGLVVAADCPLAARSDHLAFCAIEEAGPGGEMDLIEWHYTRIDDSLEEVRKQGPRAETNRFGSGISHFGAQIRTEDGAWQDQEDASGIADMIRIVTQLETGERRESQVFIPASITTRSQIERR